MKIFVIEADHCLDCCHRVPIYFSLLRSRCEGFLDAHPYMKHGVMSTYEIHEYETDTDLTV